MSPHVTGDARKRAERTDAALSDEQEERLTDYEVSLMLADAHAHSPSRKHPFCPSCVRTIERLVADRALLREGVAGLADEWESLTLEQAGWDAGFLNGSAAAAGQVRALLGGEGE